MSVPRSSDSDWRPSANLQTLRLRADMLRRLRDYFAAEDVIEVETPVLATSAATDVHLDNVRVTLSSGSDQPLFLQTSPESAMKRLLASGTGDIFQICKAFRGGEAGRMHNPEFTIVEWYRCGFDHHRLMDEVGAVIQMLMAAPRERLTLKKITYGDALSRYAGVQAYSDTEASLRNCLERAGIDVPDTTRSDRNALLDLVLADLVSPKLGRGCITFVYEFPSDQAALARVRPGEPPVAERFEAYVEGVELANGFHELTESVEQRRRMERDLKLRHTLKLEAVPLDERLLAALSEGLPRCSGVALGFDRLVMLAANLPDIRQAIAFPIDRA